MFFRLNNALLLAGKKLN